MMPPQLRARRYSEGLYESTQLFRCCGNEDDSWARDLDEKVKDKEWLEGQVARGNEVWFFYSGERLVAFGTLGINTIIRGPQTDEISFIPAMAVDA